MIDKLHDRTYKCIEAAWAQSNTFCACLEGAYTIDKTIDTLHSRAYKFYALRVGATKYFLCMSGRRLYYWQNYWYATRSRLPVLCVEQMEYEDTNTAYCK